MPRHNRTPFQREHDRVLIAEMYARGLSQYAISEQLHLTREQVKYEIEKLRKEWENSALLNTNVERQRQVRRLEMIYREAEDAWQRSKAPKDVTITKQKRRGLSGAQSDVPLDQTTEAGKRTENRDGNPVFLAEMRAVTAEIIDTLGLRVPTDTKQLGVGHAQITEIVYEPAAQANDARLVIIGGSQNGHVPALPPEYADDPDGIQEEAEA